MNIPAWEKTLRVVVLLALLPLYHSRPDEQDGEEEGLHEADPQRKDDERDKRRDAVKYVLIVRTRN